MNIQELETVKRIGLGWQILNEIPTVIRDLARGAMVFDAAGMFAAKSGKNGHEGGLARTVGTDDMHDFARLCGEGNALQNASKLITKFQVLNLKHVQ